MGTNRQLEDEQTGLFVPHNCPEAAAEAIKRLLREPEFAKRLGANLRWKVEQEYSTQVVIPAWERILDEVIAEGPLEFQNESKHCGITGWQINTNTL